MNIFKKGDKIVCIDDTVCVFLKKYNVYIVILSVNNYIKVNNLSGDYYYRRFILLSEYRKQKIKSLYE